MTSVLFFYRLKVKTTPGKGVTKVGMKKVVFDFLYENGLEKTTKTIPVGIFADNIFHHFSGVESWGEIFLFDFFRENGSQGLRRRSLQELSKHFSPLSGGRILEVNFFYSIFFS